MQDRGRVMAFTGRSHAVLNLAKAGKQGSKKAKSPPKSAQSGKDKS